MKVLVIAAHADDEVLGIGGTIARHIEKYDDVHLVTVADCRVMSDIGRDPELRRIELRESLRVLGNQHHRSIGLRALSVEADAEFNATVSAIVEEVGAHTIYTHFPGDLNRDHAAVAEAVKVACRTTTTSPPHRLCFFETPSSSEFGEPFVPNVFVQLTEGHLDKKLAAFRAYESEMRDYPHPRSEQALTARAQYWGQIAGFRLAEPLLLHRELIP